MLHITPQARTELRGMLERALNQRPETPAPGTGFRLVPSNAGGEGTRLGLALDEPREGDEIVEHEGRSVLILDASTSDLLGELTLDVVDTPEGTRLGFRE